MAYIGRDLSLPPEYPESPQSSDDMAISTEQAGEANSQAPQEWTPGDSAQPWQAHLDNWARTAQAQRQTLLRQEIDSRRPDSIRSLVSQEKNTNRRATILVEAISYAISTQTMSISDKSSIVETLLQVQDELVGDFTRKNYKDMFHTAIRQTSPVFVKILLKRQGIKQPIREEFEKTALKVLRNGELHHEVLQECIANGVFDVDEHYRLCETDSATSILHHAVMTARLDYCEVVLGFMPQQAYGYGGGNNTSEDEILYDAIRINSVDIVEKLLNHGFDPEGNIYDMRQKSTFELARPGSKVANLLREHIMAKIETEGDDYWMPERWVWDEDLQEDVARAYSLLPELDE